MSFFFWLLCHSTHEKLGVHPEEPIANQRLKLSSVIHVFYLSFNTLTPTHAHTHMESEIAYHLAQQITATYSFT